MTIATSVQSSKLPTASLSASEVATLAKTYLASDRRFSRLMSVAEAESVIDAYADEARPCGPEFAAQRARILLGCYPRGQAEDPDTYVMALSAVLSEFPEVVVRFVTDPRSGIPRTQKFLPAVAEIATACQCELDNRSTLVRLAEKHLELRRDPKKRDKLELMIGYEIGREGEREDHEMKARISAIMPKPRSA
jgi:hypothetical protein